MRLAGLKAAFLLCYAICAVWAVHGMRSEAKAQEGGNGRIYAGMLCLFNLILCLGLAWFASIGEGIGA